MDSKLLNPLKRLHLIVLLILACGSIFGQNKSIPKASKPLPFYNETVIENREGRRITDPIERKLFFEKRRKAIDNQNKKNIVSVNALPAVPLCSNGGFEEFETLSGNNVYTDAKWSNPFLN